MNILVTLNSNYIWALKVMLKSLFKTNTNEYFSIFLMYSNIPQNEICDLHSFIESEGSHLIPIFISSEVFAKATVVSYYTAEMYYRLVAHEFLPDSLDRILYLDPDIVVMNPIHNFYWTDFEDHYFVAADHEYTGKMYKQYNKFRLGTLKARYYFNSGVLLMNLNLIRKNISSNDIFSFIEQNRQKLIYPDQDILNCLYWDKIKAVDYFRYNYDVRHYELVRLIPHKRISIQWIKKNTVFIHYCGKKKPWHKHYKGELGIFFKEYESLIQ